MGECQDGSRRSQAESPGGSRRSRHEIRQTRRENRRNLHVHQRPRMGLSSPAPSPARQASRQSPLKWIYPCFRLRNPRQEERHRSAWAHSPPRAQRVRTRGGSAFFDHDLMMRRGLALQAARDASRRRGACAKPERCAAGKATNGADGGGRTRTALRPRDFKSLASTGFATSA